MCYIWLTRYICCITQPKRIKKFINKRKAKISFATNKGLSQRVRQGSKEIRWPANVWQVLDPWPRPNHRETKLHPTSSWEQQRVCETLRLVQRPIHRSLRKALSRSLVQQKALGNPLNPTAAEEAAIDTPPAPLTKNQEHRSNSRREWRRHQPYLSIAKDHEV